MKLILTGGHLTPAHAFALEALTHQDKLFVLGSMAKSSPEYQEFHRLNIPYHHILPVKFNRFRPLLSLIRLPLILISLLQSLILIYKIQPDAIVVFGGYTSIPVALAAKLFGVSLILHEQTRVVGLANRFISRFADMAAISYENSRKYLKTKHISLTGNLLRPEIWSPPSQFSFDFSSTKPILFVTGGNQGSAVILDALKPLIPELSAHYQLVIQSGRVSTTNLTNQPEVMVKPWFNAPDLAWLMHHSRIIITRAGANTTAEIMVAGVPAILIPLPNSSHQEQTLNAQIIVDYHAGILIPQPNLTSESLSKSIFELDSRYADFKKAATDLIPLQFPDAATKLYQLIAKIS